jgi:hypothetical protein
VSDSSCEPNRRGVFGKYRSGQQGVLVRSPGSTAGDQRMPAHAGAATDILGTENVRESI